MLVVLDVEVMLIVLFIVLVCEDVGDDVGVFLFELKSFMGFF